MQFVTDYSCFPLTFPSGVLTAVYSVKFVEFNSTLFSALSNVLNWYDAKTVHWAKTKRVHLFVKDNEFNKFN